MKKKKQVIKHRLTCKVTRKTMYDTYQEASYAMKRVWSHDPHMDIRDMHVYICEHCKKHHFGHISYYQKYLERRQQPST